MQKDVDGQRFHASKANVKPPKTSDGIDGNQGFSLVQKEFDFQLHKGSPCLKILKVISGRFSWNLGVTSEG
jgi:hypothetical protein